MNPYSISKEPTFSLFKSVTAKKHARTITLSHAIEKIQNGEWRQQVAQVRKILHSGSNAEYKKQRVRVLPVFSLSGEMPSKAAGKTLLSHSGLLQGDFDGKDHPHMPIDMMRKAVISSPYVVAAFISPSGNGIKAVIRIVASIESHRACFGAAERHFADLGLTIDPATKDEKRLCFVSDDATLWSRAWDEAEILSPDESGIIEPGEPSVSLDLNVDIQQQIELGNSSVHKRSISGCHTDDRDSIETQRTQITQKKGKKKGGERRSMADEVKAARRASSKLEKDARLYKLYRQYIEQKYTAKQGERNDQLVAMVTFLFRAVSEARVRSLVMAYYAINQDVFSDSQEQHENEMESHLKNTKRKWRKSLNHDERIWQDELAEERNKDHENAFRVCRELALPREDGTFFLSCAQLGARIDIDNKQAQRILLRFGKHKILDVVEKGTQHRQIMQGDKSKFEAGKATVYRWLLREVG